MRAIEAPGMNLRLGGYTSKPFSKCLYIKIKTVK